MRAPAAPHRLQRIGVYLRAMFPLHINAPMAILVFVSGYVTSAIVRGEAIRLDARAAYGVLTVFLMALLLRVFDELKDRAADAQLFAERPLVTGAVKYSDIHILGAIVAAAAVTLNLGRGAASPAFAVLFAYTLFTWRWCFVPRMSEYPEVVLLTHQPLVALIFYYIYCVYVDVTGGVPAIREGMVVALVMWPPLFAWEIARKVRAPAQETDYLTYSKRWGPRVAAGVVVVTFLTGAALTAIVGAIYGLSRFVPVYYGLVALGSSAVIIRFVVAPSPRRNRLRPVAELFVLLYYLGPLLDRLLATRL